MKKHKGMTMIELLVVVSVIATVSAIAYSYINELILKANRSLAIGDLIRIQQELESTYDASTGSYSHNEIIDGTDCLICQSSSNRYKFSINDEGTGADRYIITATAQNNQANDACGNLTLNAIGQGSSSGSDASCW